MTNTHNNKDQQPDPSPFEVCRLDKDIWGVLVRLPDGIHVLGQTPDKQLAQLVADTIAMTLKTLAPYNTLTQAPPDEPEDQFVVHLVPLRRLRAAWESAGEEATLSRVNDLAEALRHYIAGEAELYLRIWEKTAVHVEKEGNTH